MWLNDTKKFNELQKIAVDESPSGIPLLFALDVIHGYRTIFPVPLAMAASWDPAVPEKTQTIAAREARAAGERQEQLRRDFLASVSHELRTPVTEIAVKSTPIRKTAPNATGMGICCPSTRLNAVNAVREIAQPMAIGSLAHRPINREPKAAIRQVATKTGPCSKPAAPSMFGTTMML